MFSFTLLNFKVQFLSFLLLESLDAANLCYHFTPLMLMISNNSNFRPVILLVIFLHTDLSVILFTFTYGNSYRMNLAFRYFVEDQNVV